MAHGVHYFLEIGRHLLIAGLRAVTIIYMYRLVGQLEHHRSVVPELRALGHIAPHLQQVFLIVITHTDALGTDTGRAHHHIKALADGIFGHGNEHFVEIRAETVEVEGRDVVLASRLRTGCVRPVGVHVLTHKGHLPAGIQDTVDDALVVLQATLHVVVGPFLALLVEPGTEGLGKTVKVVTHTLVVDQERTLHMQW